MSEYTPLSDITITRQNIENCSFSKWYPLFKHHTTRSRILKPIPEEFIEYLKQDGIKLPNDKEFDSFYTNGVQKNDENEYSDWEDDEDEKKTNTDNVIDPIKHFKEFHDQLKDIIKELGPVTPKLNWSAPRDATWIVPNNSMKCSEVNEIYLLLNASNYIMHDLENAFDECDPNDRNNTTDPLVYELVLREWFDINPALEFRVFVKDSQIIGVSQRDLNYYDYLEALGDEFKDLIDEFVLDIVLPKFPDNSFVLDVYIPRPFDKVYLIDINPFARKTDSLLFSWNELLTQKTEKERDNKTEVEEDDDYELRLIKENNTGRFAAKEHSENQVPRDVVEASLDPNAISELAQKWKELLTQQEQEESSDEE